MIWFTTVGFGGNPAPIGPWKDTQQASEVLHRWLAREGHKAGSLVAAHTVRVYAYTSRQAARQADISDSPGRHGNVAVQGIYDFLSHVQESA